MKEIIIKCHPEDLAVKIREIEHAMDRIQNEIVECQFRCIDLTEKREKLRDEYKQLYDEAQRILEATKN